ncbi:Transient receptor putative cation channel sub M member 2 [Saguinus oedipus]|uniref:Transient receptor putative cation channel sub M member 2 n=1 Tax=Saguinus oedipus TaxID=9490 RepID=A0ABQ9TY96_SAGOE|nr:Transient receptor putative cation channel sub M member 2 [Saguinus oedipus]
MGLESPALPELWSLPRGAWIITGGSHAGVMKQVGEAVRDFSLSSSCKEDEVITIGVATWGTVHRREGLIHPMVPFGRECPCAAVPGSQHPPQLLCEG